MAVNRWLVAYDIADDDRRARVAARLLDGGIRLQQSVYEVTGPRMRDLREELPGLLDLEVDAILATPVCEACLAKQWHRGQSGPRLADPFWIA